MPNRIARILVILVGVAIILLGAYLYEITGLSLPFCYVPGNATTPNCYGGGVSHPFYFESIIVSLIGIAIVIIGSVMAYRMRTSHPKILNNQRLNYMSEFKLERQKLRDAAKQWDLEKKHALEKHNLTQIEEKTSSS